MQASLHLFFVTRYLLLPLVGCALFPGHLFALPGIVAVGEAAGALLLVDRLADVVDDGVADLLRVVAVFGHHLAVGLVVAFLAVHIGAFLLRLVAALLLSVFVALGGGTFGGENVTLI